MGAIATSDILVVGGGAAGTLAAIAAARRGHKVLLIEAQGCLGGSRTMMGVDTFNGFFSPGERTCQVVGGISYEVVQRLAARKAAFVRENTFGSGPVVTYEMEQLKIIYEEMVLEAGADLLFHTSVPQAAADGDRVGQVTICNKAGLGEVRARIVIDATGDMDVAASAGEDFELAGADGRPVQSLTTVFYMADVDNARAFTLSQEERTRIMQEAGASGRYNLTRIGGSIHATPHPGYVHANLTRVPNVDATNPAALTRAEIEGRRQVQEYARFLQDEYPGFERAYLAWTAPTIGVRETRRLKGRYVLTGEDVRQGAKFEDAVACCAAPSEDHHAGTDVRWEFLEAGAYYQIPYRSLLPLRLTNLIVAGRCLSATHEAQASARNSAQCMAMGEAAGTAAALALSTAVSLGQHDPRELQRELRAQHVILEPFPVESRSLFQ
jgi:2-polyprenyl-6-methoxyphenol hydroxylase-like FAD-dependent oxidoreductase